jgi:protease-4
VKAILFRIDSPGGSPGASETIRAALIRAQKAGKPVFVSMGGVAASGGYWVAMSADNITADPGTLTGSIGVVAGKFTTAELMRKLGVSWDTLSTSENATLWSMTKEFTPEQLARMNAFIDETYHTFVQSVSDARKIPMEKMPDVAKGRVFTGAQAQQIGLVDQLGGYDVALAALRKKLDLKPDDVVSVELFPAPMSTAEKIFKVVKNIGIESLAIHAMFGQWQQVQTVLGPFLNEAVAARPVGVYAPNTVTRLAH